MCEQTEIVYLDGDVVWVKLGSCWWPGEVVGPERLPPDVLPSFRKPPIAVVKFFQENTYEYVKNLQSIYKYNCSRKNEFINKGLYMYRTKHGHMEKFPEDVIRAETAVGGDIEILTRNEFQEVKKESYAGLFGESKKTPVTGRGGRGRPESPRISTPIRKNYREKSDYKVHILLQGAKEPLGSTTDATSTPSTSRAESEPTEDKPQNVEQPQKVEQPQNVDAPRNVEPPQKLDPQVQTFSTPTTSVSGIYSCHSCSFSTSRLNVLILHNKTHSASFTPYTPSPVRKKQPIKSSPKSTPKTSKTPKTPRPRKEKSETGVKKPSGKKRTAIDKAGTAEVKKPKTEQEIKSSLLADWDDVDDDSNDESSALILSRSPEVPVGAESPAVPIPAELSSAQISREMSSPDKKSDDLPALEKPESSSDSKYEFCEDEDWPLEADGGRKIPRVKNPSKRKEVTKSLSVDEEDVAKEVAELLNKTAVPELPSIPEPLKVEENFPEPPVIKSPDKKIEVSDVKNVSGTASEPKPIKAIFKTKTFFRSRHSRSQDAIGKYVAEQLNAAERMDMSENDINGSEFVSSPETRESPPKEQIKVARLAPKIQLKKMKAEAAQLREKEKSSFDKYDEPVSSKGIDLHLENRIDAFETVKTENALPKSLHDVLYPTQEIKPINKDLPDKLLHIEDDFHSKTFSDKQKMADVCENSVKLVAKPEDDLETNKENESLKLEEKSSNMVTAFQESLNDSRSDRDIEMFKQTGISPNKLNTKPTKICNTENVSDNEPRSHEDVTRNNVHNITNITPLIAKENAQSLPTVEQNILEEVEMTAPEVTAPLDEKESKILSSVISPNNSCEDNSFSSNRNFKVLLSSHLSPKIPCEEENNSSSNNLNNQSNTSSVTNTDQSCDKLHLTLSDNTNNELSSEISNQQITHIPSTTKINEPNLQKSYEPHMTESYMSESTASAVDALLSVSRETDRVPKIVSNDLPEDLFEDDQKDIGLLNEEKSIENNQDNEDACLNKIDKCIPQENNTELNGTSQLKIDFDDSNKIITSNEEICPPIENVKDILPESVNENIPSESDLQIAEALINLPSAAIQSSAAEHVDNVHMPLLLKNDHIEKEIIIPSEMVTEEVITSNDNLNLRYETEQEKSENLNAAQSLVQMSESIDHKINIIETTEVTNKELLNTVAFKPKQNNGLDSTSTIEQKVDLLPTENNSNNANVKSPKFETTSSKLLKMLEEPTLKAPINKLTPIKPIIAPGKEKILNFDVAKASLKGKPAPKQKIIIRRAAATSTKTIINSLNDVIASPETIILSRNSPVPDGSMQTFTIQTTKDNVPSPLHIGTTDAKQFVIQPKIRKITKPSKLQKIKPQNSIITQLKEPRSLNEQVAAEEPIFDINSMPVVLSDDILTPESIEKMPIVMSDGIITSTQNPPKLVKTKPTIIENEKIPISPIANKPEVKTLLMNPTSDVNKVTTPNILSKSSKLRGAKPMLVIDKATGKQKIIMTKTEPTVKEIKPAPPTLIQSVSQNVSKPEKFIILPTASSPRPGGRTQKIVIDPQTGKAHVLVAKGQDPPMPVPENKPVSAKLIPSSSDANSPGSTVMIITNAQGAQSRIVLTPEHEKILFPNKQQPNISQLKTITHRLSTNQGIQHKTIVTTSAPAKTQTRIVPKQKGAIITSKGQLIVGGRVATTSHNIAPMPEIRPAPKRIVATEPKKLVQAIQKNSSEPLIFLQQKSGAVMQLTAAQFEHLQKTGQIIQKTAPVPENKIVIQKSITISPKETVVPTIQKQRIRKTFTETIIPAKKLKQEIAIAPAPIPSAPLPPLTSLSSPIAAPAPAPISTIVPAVSNTVSVSTTPSYPDLDNFEELLPSTAIARQTEPTPAPLPQQPEVVIPPPEQQVEPSPTQLSDGQLLAVPGESFGGPPGTFYLCVEDNGTLTPIDNRPLVLENNSLVPMTVEPMQVFAPQPERRDILEAALANSDVFHGETTRDDAPDFRDLNANVSVHCRVSETSTTLNQPIMTPVEMPTKGESEPAVPSNLEDGLAVIGVTPHTVPTSLELPITVTDPRIAPKTTDPLSSSYGTTLLPSPNTEMTFVTTEEVGSTIMGSISMPLLNDMESVGKSMPILTDDVAERTVSSVESTVGSPSSVEVRESEAEEGGQWSRRLLTPGSDTSEASAEIPLQPVIQLSVNDLSRHS